MNHDLTLSETAQQLTAVTTNPFYAAMLTWLEGFPQTTRKNYYGTLRKMLLFLDKSPDKVTPLDIATWKEHLKQSNLSDSSIRTKLYSVSSYYRFLQRPQANGQPLFQFNPVDGVLKKDLEVSNYDKARKISVSDFRKLLSVIDVQTPKGARDYAAFLFYVLCARRRSEVVGLYGRDIRVEDDKVTYRVRLKGDKSKWKELPLPIWTAIRNYLHIIGRELAAEAPLFVATVDNGKYLQRLHGVEVTTDEQPITGEALWQALKGYARKAGLDPKLITTHSLRHLGAELFLEASGDIHETQAFLDHAHLNTTQIYLAQLTGESHKHWQAMNNKLLFLK